MNEQIQEKQSSETIPKSREALEKLAENVNILGDFCAKRDVSSLSPQALLEKAGQTQLDVFVLFGGSILAGVDRLAKAITSKIAKTTIIVGGAGHTTDTLRHQVADLFQDPDLSFEKLKDKSEAEIFQLCLQKRHGLQADFLECRSTNCGNNITFLLDLIQEKNIPCTSILLCQDGTMQHRMEATLRKFAPALTIYNYAAYQVKVRPNQDLSDPANLASVLEYESEPEGMWSIERYVELLLGEVSRLCDDKQGYGPKGAGYLAHVDIPRQVKQAFEMVKRVNLSPVRLAQSRFKDPAASVKQIHDDL